MKLWSKIRKYTRTLHRSIGYLLFGVTIIYGISGYLLNHIGGHGGDDPAFKTTEGAINLDADLSKTELRSAWNKQSNLPEVKRIANIDDNHLRIYLDGGLAVYQINSGNTEYTFHKKKPFVYYINKFHYNRLKGWTLPADLVAFSLIFLAVSGLFMVRGKNGLAGSGKWWLIAGIIIPILYIFLT